MSDKQLSIIDAPQLPAPVSVIEIFAGLARDQTIPLERIKGLMEMQERANKWEAEKAYAEAMRDAQNEMVPIVRNAENSHTKSRYATLEIIDAAIRPIYTKYGFSLTFNSPDSSEKAGVLMTCTVMHRMGHSMPYSLRGELDMSGPQGKANKTPIQGLSSSVTYLQRILTRMVFNLVFKNEDKDGNESGFVDERQTNTILDLINACEMDAAAQSKFLEFMSSEAISEIHARDYPKAVTALNAKLRKMQGR